MGNTDPSLGLVDESRLQDGLHRPVLTQSTGLRLGDLVRCRFLRGGGSSGSGCMPSRIRSRDTDLRIAMGTMCSCAKFVCHKEFRLRMPILPRREDRRVLEENQ